MMCSKPVYLAKLNMRVPCGQCMNCRISRTTQWVIRLEHEFYMSGSKGMWITLTYDDENVPRCKDGLTLSKSDLQKFFKRLRRYYDRMESNIRRFKYLAVGEYGGTLGRPHYHCIIIGLNLEEDNQVAVEACWQNGEIHFGCVEKDSIRYTVDYVQSAFISKDKRLMRKMYGSLEKPFQIQSQGLGKSYAIDNKAEIISKGKINYRGKELSVPRYYYEKVDIPNGVKARNRVKRYEELCERYGGDLIKNLFVRDEFKGMKLNKSYFLELEQSERNSIARKLIKNQRRSYG